MAIFHREVLDSNYNIIYSKPGNSCARANKFHIALMIYPLKPHHLGSKSVYLNQTHMYTTHPTTWVVFRKDHLNIMVYIRVYYSIIAKSVKSGHMFSIIIIWYKSLQYHSSNSLVQKYFLITIKIIILSSLRVSIIWYGGHGVSKHDERTK